MPDDMATKVLVLCRRRCCVCFGLKRDIGLKKGQIAHLDGRPNNNILDNLAYLCLEHHDEYDTRTSQSKGLTASELRFFRRELHQIIDEEWRKAVEIGQRTALTTGDVSGRYIRDGEFESAELELKMLADRRVSVIGLALWGKTREYGPHLGELNAEAQLNSNRIEIRQPAIRGRVYRLTLEIEGDRLTATEDYVIGQFGMNVSFAGEYRRID